MSTPPFIATADTATCATEVDAAPDLEALIDAFAVLCADLYLAGYEPPGGSDA